MEQTTIPSRTQEQINEEYSKCATYAGDKRFRILLLEAEIASIHQKMMDLTKEVALKVEEDPLHPVRDGTAS